MGDENESNRESNITKKWLLIGMHWRKEEEFPRRGLCYFRQGLLLLFLLLLLLRHVDGNDDDRRFHCRKETKGQTIGPS